MVWLDICDEQGNAIYFDIHHVEKHRVGRRWLHAVNGVCGNGLDEIEVLVEAGERDEVTFVDLSHGALCRSRLLAGIDCFSLESGLIAAAIQHCGLNNTSLVKPRAYPHPAQQVNLRANETEPVWRTVV